MIQRLSKILVTIKPIREEGNMYTPPPQGKKNYDKKNYNYKLPIIYNILYGTM